MDDNRCLFIRRDSAAGIPIHFTVPVLADPTNNTRRLDTFAVLASTDSSLLPKRRRQIFLLFFFPSGHTL